MNIPYPQPAAYMRDIPEGSSVSSNGSYYHVGSGGVVVRCGNGTSDGSREEIVDTTTGDPFSPGAIAKLPGNGLCYIKTGDIWLLEPIPSPVPVVLTGRAPGYDGYWIIKQTSYAGDSPVVDKNSAVISFNLPMNRAKDGEFSGADEKAFAHTTREADECEIYISVDALLTSPLDWSFEASATDTKGELAKDIAHAVEQLFDRPNRVFIAFIDDVLRKEVNFKDLLLVDLVQRAEGVFQPTIAVRVPPSHTAANHEG